MRPGPVVQAIDDIAELPLRFSAGLTRQLVGPHNGATNLDVHVVTLDPADRPGPLHIHPRAESVYLILHGSVQFHINGEDHEVHSEQFVFIPPGMPHAVMNTRMQPAHLIGIYAPPGDDFLQVNGTLEGGAAAP